MSAGVDDGFSVPRVPVRMKLPAHRLAVVVSSGLLISLMVIPAHAQSHPTQYVVKVWGTEEGLPQNSVTAMLQDRKGYLWMGTFGGLARFDSVRFRVFASADTPGISSGRILSLFESRSGELWIGTLDGGLIRLHDGSATPYRERDGLPSSFVNSIRGDAGGNVWVNTSRGVARIAGHKLEPYASHRGMTVSEFYLQARDGSMWFHSGTDIVRYGADGSAATLAVRKANGFLVNEDRDGSVWIAFNDRPRLVRYHRGVFSEVKLPPTVRSDFAGATPKQVVLAMANDTDGALLLMTPDGIVRIVDGSLTPPERLALPPTVRTVPKVRTLLVDREGNRWLGTDGTGLFRYRRAPLTAYGKEEGLTDSSFSAVYQDREGRIWLGGESLHWFDGRRFHLSPGLVSIRAIAQTREGDLWFGGYAGLHRLRSGVLSRFRVDAPAVRAIYQDRRGTLWIAAGAEERPGGMYRFRDEKLEPVPGISDARQIIEDRDGGIWVGGIEGVFYARDGETFRKQDLPGYIADIHQDSTGTIWLAGYGPGLLRLRAGRWKGITTRDGLPSNMLLGIREDGNGHLWFSTNQNVYRLDLQELNDLADGKAASLSPVSYGLTEGMRSSECNGGSPSIWLAADGRLWLPTQRGVVAIDPDGGDRVPPPVVLEEAEANAVTLGHDGVTPVRPGSNTLAFSFTALSFSAPEKVRFKYRLEPYDKNWLDAGAQRSVKYTNMAPGEYSFRVIAANSFGVWNDQGDSVRFLLQPKLYQTRWFYFLAAAGLALGASGAYRLRIRQLRARERHLHEVVESRTAELCSEIKARQEIETSLRQARAELEERVHERTAELRESEQRFRTFVDHAADALFVLDLEQGTLLDVNREACESLGYTREELIGETTAAFDVDVDQATMESILERAAKGETVFDTHSHRRKDGSVFPVEVHTSIVWYGGRRFLLKMARDITDRKRAEQERERLRQLEADLAHINRVSMMGELAASVAHEVNQPLTGIVSNGSACLRLLAGNSPNVEEALEALRDIVRDGKRAGEVIARIRALTKRAEMPKAQLDLNETIKEVLLLVGDEAKKNGIAVRTQFADDLSPVFGDRVQMQQVLLNLLINAIEAMNSVSGRARELVIRTRNLDGGSVQITMVDSGIGLDASTMSRIFEPFYTTKASGMGMGLSISRSIVQSHGGRLWATPNEGSGTTFHFVLPADSREESHAGVGCG
jgi:PAS domain S-box-containing protein